MKTQTIWKYELATIGDSIIELPDGADVLQVANQRERLTLWARVDASRPVRKRRFVSLVTGGDASDVARANYIGTVQLSDGYLVAHVFDGGWQ